jgi:CheY-like chemotaxis protein
MTEIEGLRILLVEDEQLVAMLVEDMLGDLGCHMIQCASGLEEAIDIARSGEFDFAMLDMNLNGDPVFPVAEILLERGIPFAFASGYGAGGLPEKMRDRQVITKPFKLDDVSAVIASNFGGPATA